MQILYKWKLLPFWHCIAWNAISLTINFLPISGIAMLIQKQYCKRLCFVTNSFLIVSTENNISDSCPVCPPTYLENLCLSRYQATWESVVIKQRNRPFGPTFPGWPRCPHLHQSHCPYPFKPFLFIYLCKSILNVVILPASTTLSSSSFGYPPSVWKTLRSLIKSLPSHFKSMSSSSG